MSTAAAAGKDADRPTAQAAGPAPYGGQCIALATACGGGRFPTNAATALRRHLLQRPVGGPVAFITQFGGAPVKVPGQGAQGWVRRIVQRGAGDAQEVQIATGQCLV